MRPEPPSAKSSLLQPPRAARTVSISVLPPHHEREAAEVLAQAFRDGPMTRAVVGSSPGRRLRSNRYGMRQSLRGCRDQGFVLTASWATDSGVVVDSHDRSPEGVLIALPAGTFPLPAPSLLDQLGSAFVQGFRVASRWGDVYRELESVHPLGRHWYLSLLGVSPQRQREGMGTALLEFWLERVDQDAASSYLETDLEANVAFYERAGFQVRSELAVLDTRIWCLWRPARAGSGSPNDPT